MSHDPGTRIRVLDYRSGRPPAEHVVTHGFLASKAREFVRGIYAALENGLGTPRVCIAGHIDYLYLRTYAADYLGPCSHIQATPTLPEGFPDHFTYRGVTVFRGQENGEPGFTFA